MMFSDSSFTLMLADQTQGELEFITGPFPVVDPAESRGLPIGGAMATLLTDDPAVTEAAWRFIEFATGPEGQKHVVRFEGFPPVNTRAYDIPEVAEFFQENPLRQPDVDQLQRAQPWVAFPGENSVRITRVIRDNVDRVVQQSATPREVLDSMAAEIQPLLGD
jgi:multiple sugar transport system substrate-binding protein